MTTVAPLNRSRTSGPAEADRVAPLGDVSRLALVDAGGTSLADLTDAPQTIGGGPRCSIRLDAAGLRPLHCVITPSQDGPVVRRWATETRLNGQDFTEAALSAGDLLRIGSIDLRVVALPSELPAAKKPEPAAMKAALTDEVPLVQPPKSDAPAPKPTAATPAKRDDVAGPVGSAPAAEFDPAIPSRLLRPWAPEKPVSVPASHDSAMPATDSEEASGDDPFAAFGGFALAEASAAEFVPAEEPVSSMDSAFGVLLEQPAFVEEAPALVGSETDTDDDPWSVVTPVAAIVEPVAAYDPTAAAAFGADSIVNNVEPAVLTPADNSIVERLRERTAASRARVSQLVAALRAERRQSAELTGVVTDLATQLEQALVATDEAGIELSRLAAEQAATHEDFAITREALAEATSRAELLEAHVIELEASLAAISVAAETSPVADFAEQEETASEFAAEPVWGNDADSVPVFADEVLDDVGAETAPAEQYDWQTLPEAEAAEAADEPLWGIERLAATEEPSPIDSTWVGVVEEPHAAHSAEAPKPNEAEPSEAVPSEVARWEDEPVATAYEYDEPTATLPEPEDFASEPDNAALQSIVDLWGATQEPTEEPVARPKPEPQESFIERFAHLVPEEDEPLDTPAQRLAAIAAVPTAPASDNDESIDDYMRKLMQRVRGTSTNEDNPVPARKPAAMVAETADEDRSQPAQEELVEAPPAKQEMFRDLSELRRGPAPEVMTNMGALRQLANQSARHAIDVAASRQSREKATIRLTLSVIAVAVGTLASIVAESHFDLQFIGGFTLVVVGGWFFVRTVRQCQVRTLDQQIALAAKHAG